MKRMILAAVAAAMIASVGSATAGLKSYFPLSINYSARYANGGLSETHNTADNVQYVECGSNGNTGYCTIRDTAGTITSCFTTDAALLAVIRSMSPESTFSIGWTSTGVCNYVLSYASSRTEAKN